MQDVGTFLDRNKTFNNNFTRKSIISKCFEGKTCPIIFDVGSHHGESLKFFKEISPYASIYCFEPDPESYAILKKNFPNYKYIYNLAISDKKGHENFYRNPISHTNSLYKINLQSNDSIKIMEEKETRKSNFSEIVNQKVTVSSSTLDFIIPDHEINQIDLLKIDVQGAETKVLNGAKNILHIVDALIVEVAFFDFYEKSNNFRDIENILIPAGFSLFSILDISHNPMNGRTDWVEVLYKRVKK